MRSIATMKTQTMSKSESPKVVRFKKSESIYINVRIEKKLKRSLFQYIVYCPSRWYFSRISGHEMATSQNVVNGNNGRISTSVAGRTCYRIKTRTCFGPTKRCKPLDICKRVLKSAEMRWKIKNETNLCDAKT
jgi:hypothetical protein